MIPTDLNLSLPFKYKSFFPASMAEESFMLVSLKEYKAKKLAQVISNESCRKILDYLSRKKTATETKIAKELNLPLSTVHYNLKHLKQSNLVVAEEFHYSKKGKEVNHYRIANKLIIISPAKRTEGFLNKLKELLPLGMIAVAAAGAIQLYSKLSAPSVLWAQKAMAVNTMAMEAAERAAPIAAPPIETAPEPNIALWFLTGSVFIMVVYIVLGLLRKNRQTL